jgi:UDP-galactopyranose mutase
LQKFSEWIPYNHSELVLVNDKYVPIPVNIDTVNTLLDLNISSAKEMDARLEQERVEYNRSPANAEEVALSRVGRRLYHLIYKPLLIKQWNQFPSFLSPDFTSHVSVRSNHETAYYNDTFQALPTGGYTTMFENLLQHDKIDVSISVDYFSVRNHLTCGKTFYTGPIDSYFADYGWDKLEYRSLESKRVTKYNVTAHFHQPVSVVNHPKLETPYSRIVEYRHLPGQQTSSHTVYFQDNGEPYYPVRNKRINDLFSKYNEMAEKEKDVVFVGRLASYEYLDMDETILTALKVFDSETKATQESS